MKFDTVLKLGSGTGKNTSFLLKKASKVICLVFSKEMMDISKRKNTSDRVQFIQTDLNDEWRIPDKYIIDLITCSLTLEHIQDLDKLFKRAYNNLINNGKFFISELHPFKQYLENKAQFEIKGKIHNLEVYTHHISDYLGAASRVGFRPVEIREWFDDEKNTNQPLKILRLISFVFEK